MVQTGADILSSLVEIEVKNNWKEIGSANRQTANGKIRTMPKKYPAVEAAQKAAQSGYYDEIRNMVKQQCYREQG